MTLDEWRIDIQAFYDRQDAQRPGDLERMRQSLAIVGDYLATFATVSPRYAPLPDPLVIEALLVLKDDCQVMIDQLDRLIEVEQEAT